MSPVLLFSTLLGFASALDWDFVVSFKRNLEFYKKNETHLIPVNSIRFLDLGPITHDPINNILYYFETALPNNVIASIDLDNKNKIVRSYVNGTVRDMVYDPVSQKLFWIGQDNNRIYSLYVKPLSTSSSVSELFISESDSGNPNGITVDSCNGKIYWTDTKNDKPRIMQANTDGSNVKAIISDDLHFPVDITVDMFSKKIYWADNRDGVYYRIESANLDGSKRTVLLQDRHHNPHKIISYDGEIYWIEGSDKNVWKIFTNESEYQTPFLVKTFDDSLLVDIIRRENIANFPDKTGECQKLVSLYESRTENKSNLTSEDCSNFMNCLNGGVLQKRNKNALDDNTCHCECIPGYSGMYCDKYVCHNYCVHGECSVNYRGSPICRCHFGYEGDRCEEHMRCEKCKNDGICTYIGNKTGCLCKDGWRGEYCEIKDESKSFSIETHNNVHKNTHEDEYMEKLVAVANISTSMQDLLYKMKNYTERTEMYLIIAISCSSIALMLMVIVLIIFRVPTIRNTRIIKKIIGKRPVKGVSFPKRPIRKECEITIEDCCNMNICETPCFDRAALIPNM